MPQPYRPKGSKQREKEAAFVQPPRREEIALASPQPKFGQALGSSDKEVREKAVKALQGYLQRASDIEELELRKIWKALFYCFWHSDKPKVQRDLAEQLAGLLHMVPPEQAMPFARCACALSRPVASRALCRFPRALSLPARSVASARKRDSRSAWCDPLYPRAAAPSGR